MVKFETHIEPRFRFINDPIHFFVVLVLSENHDGVLKELKQLCTPRISSRNISTHNKIRMDSGCVLRNDRFVFCAESAGVNNTLSRVLSPGMFSF